MNVLKHPWSSRVHWGTRLHFFWPYILSNCVSEDQEARKLMKPQASQLWRLLCRRYIIPSNIGHQEGIKMSSANPRFLCLSFISFSSLISYLLTRRRNGSQCQIRDDVSPLPRARATGASHPQSERGSRKGEMSCSPCTDWNLQLYYHHHAY